MEGDAERLIRAFFSSISEGIRLLNEEPNLIETRGGLGETALHYLAVENQIDAVRTLVTRGANVNTLSDVGGTPLSEAASLGYVDLVKYLLSVGARLKVDGQSEPTIHEAVRSGKPDMVKLILEAGAEVNEIASLDETPLHVAAEEDENTEIVRILVAAGADLQARRIFDETPLAVAQRAGAAKVAEELVRLGAR
jgi:ankyrin repeat protein